MTTKRKAAKSAKKPSRSDESGQEGEVGAKVEGCAKDDGQGCVFDRDESAEDRQATSRGDAEGVIGRE